MLSQITLRKSFITTLAVFIGAVFLINLLLDEPTFEKLSDEAAYEIKSNQYEKAETALFRILQQDSLRIDNHYNYIKNHFSIPARTKVGKRSYRGRPDNPIKIYYSSLAQSNDATMSDIGYYGRGLIEANLKNYSEALTYYGQVKNRSLSHLNNSKGYCYMQIGNYVEAEKCLRKEIQNKGHLNAAYDNLIHLLYFLGRDTELRDFLNDQKTARYFPIEIERAYYFRTAQPIGYTISVFKNVFSGFNAWGAVAALLIMCSWIMYLRKIDLYEVEKWKHIIITVVLGMLFSFLTFPLTDIDNAIIGFSLNGDILNDFFYSVLGIGAIEEFVKIVPLLIMLRFTTAINEPFDYIKYASLSALGFAFVENLMYFDEDSLNIIHGRAFTAVVTHMFDSSLIAYGLILNKYKLHKNAYLNFIVFFALAAISHGFYDFWLINKSASTFSIITLAFLLTSMYVWNSFKNNALNHSDFYDKNKSLVTEKIQDYLLYSLAGVLLFEYLALAFKYSAALANSELFSSLGSGTYLIIFLSTNLGKFSITKGYWAPINFWGKVPTRDFETVVESTITLKNFNLSDFGSAYVPSTGTIYKRITLLDETDWYLVKIANPKQSNSYLSDIVLIRTKDKSEHLEKGQKKLIAFFLIPKDTNLEKIPLKRTDFVFCGWATAE